MKLSFVEKNNGLLCSYSINSLKKKQFGKRRFLMKSESSLRLTEIKPQNILNSKGWEIKIE